MMLQNKNKLYLFSNKIINITLVILVSNNHYSSGSQSSPVYSWCYYFKVSIKASGNKQDRFNSPNLSITIR